MKISGCAAIVTGGCQGIGRGIVYALLRKNAKVGTKLRTSVIINSSISVLDDLVCFIYLLIIYILYFTWFKLNTGLDGQYWA